MTPASTMTGLRAAGPALNDRVTGGAAAYLAFPACEAVIVQVPAVTAVTAEPDTVHTPGVPEVNDTTSPDVADADNRTTRPAVVPGGRPNVIVCRASRRRAGLTWNDRVTGGAAA